VPTTRHITIPAGFLAAGVRCGIKASGREDLAIIAACRDASAAIVTTRNQLVGAPVVWCRKVLPRGYGKVRAIVINSGCANACNGPAGLRDAEAMAVLTARRLGTTPRKVLVASTGVIGQRLPMDKIRAGIRDAAASLGTRNDAAALAAVMTTDTRPKYAVATTRINGRRVRVAGIIKGAGMIAPSMATMIGVITTDAAISPAALHRALVTAVDSTLNAVTIDSDTSTSDTVVLLASGLAGNRQITRGGSAYAKFVGALTGVCGRLARAVAADGEGATKLIEIAVRGARNAADAEAAAKSVANSPLVKCAVHGGDPNWGRIAAALGKSTARVAPQKLAIRIGGVKVFARGRGLRFDLKKVEKHLVGKTVRVACDLGLGSGQYTALTCDFSRKYVEINADYHT